MLKVLISLANSKIFRIFTSLKKKDKRGSKHHQGSAQIGDGGATRRWLIVPAAALSKENLTIIRPVR